jgi:Ras-related protein Rap-1B
MKTGQGFLLVFSITSLTSLTELYELRDQILRIKDSTTVPIVLVGNKSDLEDDRAVSRARAFQVSRSWGCVPYYEASARRRANVDEVFRDLCRQIMRQDMDMESKGQPSMGSPAFQPQRKKNGRGNSHDKESRRRRSGPCTIL